MGAVEICNKALSLAGSKSLLSSLSTEGSLEELCNTHYDLTRAELLMAVAWPFNRKQKTLALIASASGTDENPDGVEAQTNNQWSYVYAYPSDCLKPIFLVPSSDANITTPFSNMSYVRDAQENMVQWVEGLYRQGSNDIRCINTDKQTASMIYVADVINTDLFPKDFEGLLVQTLAARLSMGITGDYKIIQLLDTKATNMLTRYAQIYGEEHTKDMRPVTLSSIPSSLIARLDYPDDEGTGWNLYPYTTRSL